MRELERQFVQRCTYVGVDVALSMRLYDHLEKTARAPDRCIKAIESWLIRRMLTGCNAGGYNGLFRDLLLRFPCEITSRLQKFGTWPRKSCVRRHVESTPISRRKSRKIRMVLESIESFLNAESKEACSGVVPSSLEIEHVMPLKWRGQEKNWPPYGKGASDGKERDEIIWTLGNLTLLPSELNSEVSNHSWKDKQATLRQHEKKLCLLTQCLLKHYEDSEWNEDSIRQRGSELAEHICKIWPDATDC